MATTVTQVACNTTSKALASADDNRDALYVYNASSVTAYVLLGGGTASSTNASFALPAGSTWEAPSSKAARKAVSGVLASSTGTITVTEVS